MAYTRNELCEIRHRREKNGFYLERDIVNSIMNAGIFSQYINNISVVSSSSYRSSKHPKQTGSNPDYLVNVPLIPHIAGKHLKSMNINTVDCQCICNLTVKHFEQVDSNADNLIPVSMSSHSTVKHVNTTNTDLVRCQSLCNKCNDISDYVKDLDHKIIDD